jgi:hypothetical protein
MSRASSKGRRVTVTFNEPVMGVSRSTLRLIGPNGRALSASVRFTAGKRTARLTAGSALAPGAHYRLRAGARVTDVALNVVRPRERTFTAR